jgi:TPR repeat protein
MTVPAHEAELMEASAAISEERYEKALAILSPLVSQEVPGALGLLGAMHQLGLGVERDGPKAVELLTKAAELGDGTSAHNLGTIYAMGMPGVPQNFQLSRQFYRTAKAMGAQVAIDSFYE